MLLGTSEGTFDDTSDDNLDEALRFRKMMRKRVLDTLSTPIDNGIGRLERKMN